MGPIVGPPRFPGFDRALVCPLGLQTRLGPSFGGPGSRIAMFVPSRQKFLCIYLGMLPWPLAVLDDDKPKCLRVRLGTLSCGMNVPLGFFNPRVAIAGISIFR